MKRSLAWFAMGMLLSPALSLARRTGVVKGNVLDEDHPPLRVASARVVSIRPLRAAPFSTFFSPSIGYGGIMAHARLDPTGD